MTDQEVQVRIAHLQMLQGVIGRMASDIQTLKTIAITLSAAVLALGVGTGLARWIAAVGIVPTGIFWVLSANTLHIERAYRALFDTVRTGQTVEPFSMDWRSHRDTVAPVSRLIWSYSIAWPFGAVIGILVLVTLVSWLVYAGPPAGGCDAERSALSKTIP